MRFGYSDICLEHDTGDQHPEHPDRLRAVRRALADEHGVAYAEADPVDADLLATVHDPAYVERVRDFCAEGGGHWDDDTVAVEATWDAARRSAGLARWAAMTALDSADGRDTPFSLGRPPGHHALADDAMGFCFFNCAAVAAEAALATVDSVAIFDWDVHHGNGTQDIFYDRGDVCYISTHERDIFPGTGAVGQAGTGDGAGTTLNVPLRAGCDDADYAVVFEELVRPTLTGFDPDLLLVSAGFDAHERDPISRMDVSTEGFGWLADGVRTVADAVDAPLAFVLEGGYSLDSLADSAVAVNSVFDGYRPGDPAGDASERARDAIDAVRDIHDIG